MLHNKAVIRQLLTIFMWELICTAAMIGVYALIGKISGSVLLGAAVGVILAMLNQLFLAVSVSKACDKVESTGEAGKAALHIQSSSVARRLALALIYIILFKAKACDPVASLLPLVFIRVSITLMEFFRKDGAENI